MGLRTSRKIKKIIKLIEDGEIEDFEDLYKYTNSHEIIHNDNVISLLLHKEGVGYNNLPGWMKNKSWVVSSLVKQGKVEYKDLPEEVKENYNLAENLLINGKVEYKDLPETIKISLSKHNLDLIENLLINGKVEYKDLSEEIERSLYKYHPAVTEDLVINGKVEYKDLPENIKISLLIYSPDLTENLVRNGKVEYKDVPSLMKTKDLFCKAIENIAATRIGFERYEKIILNPLIKQGKVSYKDLPDEYKRYGYTAAQILKNVVRYGKDEYKDLPYELKNEPGIVLELLEAGKIRSYSVLTQRAQSSPDVVKTLLAKQGKVEYNQLPDDLNLKLECMRAFAEAGKLKRKDLPILPENPDDVRALEKETGMKLEDIKARMEECVQISKDAARILKEEAKFAKAKKTVETAVPEEHIEEKTKTVEVERVAENKVEPKKETALEKELREINEKLAELWAKKEEMEKNKASKIDDVIGR